MPDKPQSAAGARRKVPAATPTKKKTKRAVKAGRFLRAGKKKTGRGKKQVLSAQCSVPKKKEPFERVLEAAKRKAAKKRAGVPAVPLKTVKPKVLKPSEAMPDGQQENFCQKMAMGVFSNYSCYLQAWPGVTVESARALSSLLLTNINIEARIAWIRAEALKNVHITLEQQLLWYMAVKDTAVGFLDDESPLAQEVERTIAGTEETGVITKVKVKTPCKMSAAKQIDKLKGFEKPQELNVNLGYEPPGKAMERLMGKGVDLAAILKKAGLTK